ncbi:Metal homeostatis protein BSD2 [Hypsizygus marmoreus]|uniref:Metal homeostatis protein BSD2 n=1 Tax=Hypsizygus marmoreus TaxID=39966 RepID=A0A369JQZ9_HYPMA|nr:Metal homeostatis protein BSD2 [Hypsizygus marmoreus]
MSARYTALNSRADSDAHHDMEAAFDYSEDEDDDHNNASESQPLHPTPTSPSTFQAPRAHQHVPGTYDFENVDYDYPPPGSPPRPSAVALPNNYGNSNGLVPPIDLSSAPGPHHNWFQRTASSVLPARVSQRLGITYQRPAGAIGGGTNNDGVFANVTAKPTRPVTIQEGDETYVVPEDSRAEAPPSYASAQADAVPPYWETTVHAPFTPGAVGEMIVDSLPTGSLFSFLWNMLVSVSFQFVGFLLTYLLHTTHAARLGSRAGLGVTLIQYGFALRGKLDGGNGTDPDIGSWSGWGVEPPRPTTTEGEYYNHHGGMMNSTNGLYPPGMTEDQANQMVADATTEWLSFFLMTVGWFILLTSLLGFWRVKHWERGILASQQGSTTPQIENPAPFTLISRMEHTFGLRGTSRGDLFRQGFGLGPSRTRTSVEEEEATRLAEEGAADGQGVHDDSEHALESDLTIPIDPNDPNRSRMIAEALERDRRLQVELRNAGLL